MSVIIETTLGDITVDLYLRARPRTCLNFLKLCKMKYYNYCLIHSVQRNFLIQTGDPLGTGRGGESVFSKLYGDQAKFFEAEVVPKMKHHKLGTLSMVNNGENAHGSQKEAKLNGALIESASIASYIDSICASGNMTAKPIWLLPLAYLATAMDAFLFFITTGEELDYLDGVHTVFGEVSEGFEVLMKINAAICDEDHRPYKDIRITHTVILDDPYDDPAGLEFPDRSPALTEEQLKTERIGVDEDIDDTEGKTLEEVEEEIKDKEAKARATILEMVGDLPEADVKPPDNVLFVCKLNPVTTDEDLEIIFSRFGKIVSCEVVRDRKTGESLQYAFIEFDKEEDCENAYFKMDNVLIDDRRIHVDFSQSVSKLNYPEKGHHSKDSAMKATKLVLKKERNQGNYSMVFDDYEIPVSKEQSKNQPKRSRSENVIDIKNKSRRMYDLKDQASDKFYRKERERHSHHSAVSKKSKQHTSHSESGKSESRDHRHQKK